MDRLQYAANAVAEEAAEIAQAALKISRFGAESVDPATGVTGLQKLIAELNELEGALTLLDEELAAKGLSLAGRGDQEAIGNKIQKILKYAAVSIQRKLLRT